MGTLRNKIKTLFGKADVRQSLQTKKGKKIFKISICMICVLALVTGGFFVYQAKFGTKVSADEQVARVTRGTIANSIEGSGTIEAIDQYEVTSLVKGEILTCTFEEGDTVQKDDLLYELDSSDLDNSIQKGMSSIEKAQLNSQQTNKTIKNQTVYSDISGVLTNVYVENGDEIQNGAKLADVVNSDTMILKIPFNANDASHLYVGQNAQVSLESSFTTVGGTVQSVSSGAMSNSAGVSVITVEIAVGNPGGIQNGDKATALVGDVACNAAGTFTYSKEGTIVAKTSGEVYGLQYAEGDYIANGAYFLSLRDDDLSTTIRQNELSLQDAQLELQKLYDQKEDYKITAPISGKVIQKTSKAGDKLDNSNSSTVMAIIADLSTLVFEMSVDELDITNVEVGQEVMITADAIDGQVFTGHISNVSIVGTSMNGVTSYPVKVTVDNGEESGLIPGMNVSATVVTESAENVLMVPVSAIQRGNVVYVKDGNASAQTDNKDAKPTEAKKEGNAPEDGMPGGNMPEGAVPPSGAPETGTPEESADKKEKTDKNDKAGKSNVPEGFREVKVETGISSDAFVEIISGLQEGDTVWIPNKSGDVTTTKESAEQGGMMGGGMPGGMGGGMSGGGGGMPSGGGGMPGGGGMR